MSQDRLSQIFEALTVNQLSRLDPRFAPMLDGPQKTRDIDAECGYPKKLAIEDYMQMYERNDVAARVVDVEPNACWKEHPEIYETEEQRKTEFEKAVDELVSTTRLYSYLSRIDRISGIGEYGVFFIGFDDGEEFDTPAPGFDEHNPLDTPGTTKVLYYRVFSQDQATIESYESDKKNRRYGLPLYYNLYFEEVSPDTDGAPSRVEVIKVHWSRVIHIADNLLTSEVFGQPRQRNVFNRLMDLRKINGGAGEMFWKGGFPGYSFEVDPQNGELGEDDRQAIKDEILKWENGLTRYFAGVGVKMVSLMPQLTDPTPYVDNCLKLIAATKEIPIQFLVGRQSGSEAGRDQDNMAWTERVALRRNMYVTPCIIRPVIDRLQQAGALPPTEEKDGKPVEYVVKWSPLAQMTEKEKAEVGLKRTEALARYATAGAEALVPLPEFLTTFLKLTYQEAEAISKAPPTELSVVLQQLSMAMEAGATGAAGGNVPTSVPKMAKTKDPTKTPKNVVQPAKQKNNPQ